MRLVVCLFNVCVCAVVVKCNDSDCIQRRGCDNNNWCDTKQTNPTCIYKDEYDQQMTVNLCGSHGPHMRSHRGCHSFNGTERPRCPYDNSTFCFKDCRTHCRTATQSSSTRISSVSNVDHAKDDKNTEESSESNVTKLVVVGAAALIALAIILLLIVCFLYGDRKSKKKLAETSPAPQKQNHMGGYKRKTGVASPVAKSNITPTSGVTSQGMFVNPLSETQASLTFTDELG